MTAIPQAEACLADTRRNEQIATFSTMYTHYSAALLKVLVRLIGDHDQAEDLLQDTFVKAWLHIHQYDPAQGRPYTWLLTITRHVALDELRNRKIHAQAMAYTSERSSAWTEPAFHDGLVNGTILILLPLKYRRIIELTYSYGWTQQKIALELDIP